ncbi:DegV family protein [Nocardioides sp. MJB4]|uniref:DegV family protein n=1 Tax=Nocardioides donggukensis TaxID=2774019 RepID=A0A927K4K3_9ACTN|nr:DegV family protein [Nocardioides donggukensis]
MPHVVVVTDSSASLSTEVAEAAGIVVVPLQVVIGATSYDEGTEATPAMVAEALRDYTPVSTSRPGPAVFGEVYARAAAEGATAVVSVHLSARMSGTAESAEQAARDAPLPVLTLDTRQVGPATGYAALAAVAVLERGGTPEEALGAARRRADRSTSLFYVDTLEYLRRGGRVGAAAALLGGALSVKPLLRIEDGSVQPFEKVRTAGKALARLEEHAVEAAGGRPVEATVAHLAGADRAQALAGRLTERLELAAPIRLAELGAALGAHVGPGMVAVCVAPALD